MERVSDYFNLGRTQPSLEFLDVDIKGDTRAFLDPRALRSIESDWGAECVSLVQSFFTAVLDEIRSGNHVRARELLSSLSEPNETHLGLSRGRARGHGMGRQLARDAWEALRNSRAVGSGLLSDLEDTVLFIDGIDKDIVSDITTNIIREPLIRFTQDACTYYGIPLTPNVSSGAVWDRQRKNWSQRLVALPRTRHGKMLLVPKSIVRRKTQFDAGEYYNDFVIPFLADEELRAGSSLVEVLKSGRRRVTKKSVKNKHRGVRRKLLNLETTLRNEALLEQYRSQKSARRLPPSHGAIANFTDTELPDWDALLRAVLDIPSGNDGAAAYHKAVEALLTALFYPALDFPQREEKIHQGRKRIDILYTNRDTSGFFSWLANEHGVPSMFVPVECKNYGHEIANPEVDQLSGRFSPSRGRVGLLCHRGFGDKQRWLDRCRDTALDDRGFIIALDDHDLEALVKYRKQTPDALSFPLLFERFRALVS